METIEVRDLPEDVAEFVRLRAELMGISPAEYLRQQTITEARRKDRSAVLAAAREALSRSPGPGLSTESILQALDEIRGD
ncbi:MAG: antitoxin [Pseudonocardiales bacterium]|nr:antitoxin [Pseudonocardiales bacterium]